MIQRITAAHLQQLDNNQKDALRNAWNPQEGEYIALGDHEEMIYYLNGVEKHKALPLLTIGQMIEYLYKLDTSFTLHYIPGEWLLSYSGTTIKNTELCNALWEAMKAIL